MLTTEKLLFAKDKYNPKDYNWYPVAPSNRPATSGEFYSGLMRSNAKDMYNRYKRFSESGRDAAKIENEIKESTTINFKDESDINYSTVIDVFNLKARAEVSTPDVKLLFEKELRSPPQVTVFYDDFTYRYLFSPKTNSIGYSIKW